VFDLRERRAERRCALLLLTLAALAPALVIRNLGLMIALVAGLIAIAVIGTGFWFAGWLGGRRALVRLVWRPDGSWCLIQADGREFEGQLQPASRMSPAAIWLRWALHEPPSPIPDAPRPGGMPARTLLLLPQDLPRADFRRLLVRLRLDQSECAPTAAQANS